MKTKKSIGKRLLDGLYSVIPVAQDPAREWVRKIAFLMALLVFISAGYFLLEEVWWHPSRMNETADTLRDWYHSGETDDPSLPDGEEDTTVYPEGMNPAFNTLYRHNNDVRGWLTFKAGSDSADLFEGAIDNPVVQTTDNDYYLTHDYWDEYDKAGTLFFDYRNDLSAGATNRNLIIYGHNIKSGLMFSRFNQLVTGNLMRARKLTTLNLDTLYDQRVYKVFAVGVFNVNEDEGPVFNYLRTKFSSEQDFLTFVSEIRRRSLYDFGDVDVQRGDEILTLSSCTNRRESHLKDGRVVVFARRLRDGEEATVDTTRTVLNDDVLMPWAWYHNQDLPIPEEYRLFNNSTTTTTKKPTTTVKPTTTRPTTTGSDGQTETTTTVSTTVGQGTTVTAPTSGTTAAATTTQPTTAGATTTAAPTTTAGVTTTTAEQTTTTAQVTTTTAEPTTTTTEATEATAETTVAAE